MPSQNIVSTEWIPFAEKNSQNDIGSPRLSLPLPTFRNREYKADWQLHIYFSSSALRRVRQKPIQIPRTNVIQLYFLRKAHAELTAIRLKSSHNNTMISHDIRCNLTVSFCLFYFSHQTTHFAFAEADKKKRTQVSISDRNARNAHEIRSSFRSPPNPLVHCSELRHCSVKEFTCGIHFNKGK